MEKARTLNRKVNLVTMLSNVTQLWVPELRCKEDRMCYRTPGFTGTKHSHFLGVIFPGPSSEIYFSHILLKAMFHHVMDIFLDI